MSEDYLFNGTGAPDPDVERLERTLGRLRSTATPPILRHVGAELAPPGPTPPGPTKVGPYTLNARFLLPALAAAAAIVLMVGSLTRESRRSSPEEVASGGGSSWQVSVIIGTPRVAGQELVGEGRIAVGQTLTTGEGSRAKMAVSDIGWVDVDERSRVRLIETRDGRHRLALDRGTLHASIAAPPGQFVVGPPSGTATDLGCIYSLRVNDDGSGLLSVEAGWVAFEEGGRESFVPAGASSRTDRATGPGTPRYDDTEPSFRAAIDDLDNISRSTRRENALRYVLAHARGRDAMTLWHLIPRVNSDERAAVVDALAARVPMPGRVSRAEVLRLDRAALDQWWDALGLDEASWWRKWKGAYPGHAGYNQKNMMVKPADVTPTISGTRIDVPAPPMAVRWVPQVRGEFQTMGLEFPTEGCWRITATAGDRELTFVTSVRPRPAPTR